MGIFIELVLAVELPDNIPDHVFRVIKLLINGTPVDRTGLSKDLPGGLLADGGVGFPGKRSSTLEKNDYSPSFDLTIRTNKKDLYAGEFNNFLAWIAQYTITKGFVGYIRNELDGDPQLIYFREDKAFLKKVSGEEKLITEDLSMFDPK